jgi:3-oxoacyl-[acyl-carrier protein] reductase
MRTAIVTGGRRGIGAAIAVALAKSGFNILVSDVEQDGAAETTLNAIESVGVKAAFHKSDISNIAAHAEILAAAAKLNGKLSCLVNNAGIGTLVRGDLLNLTPESYDRVMAINLRGAFFLSQAFAKHLVANCDVTEQGDFRSIINITSANAEMIATERADYNISKSALSMTTRIFAARLAQHHINVYELRPGLIKTDMTAPVTAKYDKYVEDGTVPMRRWGMPEDVGQAVAALASGAFGYSTGDAIWVDGGFGLRRM